MNLFIAVPDFKDTQQHSICRWGKTWSILIQ